MNDSVRSDPDHLRTELFLATPLRPELVDLDTEAYVASPDVIRIHSDGRWPTAGFTRDDNLPLVEQHWADHQAARAFTYALLDPSRSRSLGCVYVNPLTDYLRRAAASDETLASYASARAAMVTYWIRQDRVEELSAPVAAAVDAWLTNDWSLAHLWRVLPAERASVAALRELGLRAVELELAAEPRPHLWFGR